MAYCPNCGQFVDDKAKFCSNCGTAMNTEKKESQSERRQEFRGKVYKCPNCGETLVQHCNNN